MLTNQPTNGNDTITGTPNDDVISALAGDDVVEALEGNDRVNGNAGNDTLDGGDGIDILNGGTGNDELEGAFGDDRAIGGDGNDSLLWDDGDGNDRMSGNRGEDTVAVEGSLAEGDDFVLQQEGTQAIFDRVNLGPFKLTVDTSEAFEVDGVGGNDRFTVKDLANTDVKSVEFSGGEGDDFLNGGETSTPISAKGDAGNDTLIGSSVKDLLDGGTGNDLVIGAKGDDRMIGGRGNDTLAWADGDGNGSHEWQPRYRHNRRPRLSG
jgi:Ca2+-binding RTX toxin-like protein